MKLLKTIFLVIALVLAMPMVTSCSEDEKETEALNPVKGSIVGSWEYSDDIPGDSRMTEKYTFNSDGTFINTWEAYDYVADVPRSGSLSGSYKIENGIISLVYNIADGDNVVETLHISIETDYIKFTDDEGNSMIYYKIDNSQSNPLVGTWEYTNSGNSFVDDEGCVYYKR